MGTVTQALPVARNEALDRLSIFDIIGSTDEVVDS